MLTLHSPEWLDENSPDSEGFRSTLTNKEDKGEGSDNPMHYYNLADMTGVNCACMPGSHFCVMEEKYVMRFQHYPGTIVEKYWTHPEVHGHDRPYIDASVSAMRQHMEEHPEIQEFLDAHDDDETLFVHCRLGDMGELEHTVYLQIEKAIKHGGFKKAIICTGVMSNWANLPQQRQNGPQWPGTIDECHQTTWNTLKRLSDLPCTVQFCFGDVDEHFCVMANAKNLMTHRGSYTTFLAYIGSGRIYLSHPAVASLRATAPNRPELAQRPNYIWSY